MANQKSDIDRTALHADLKEVVDYFRTAEADYYADLVEDARTLLAPEPPEVLSPHALLRLGALTIEQEKSEGVERVLEDQEIAYEEALRLHGPKGLIVALLDRDRLLLQQGRTIADGRMVSRLARELVRASLYSAGRVDAQSVQRAIDQFGAGEADPAGVADARQLKLHGSTLGPLVSPEKAAEALVEGTLKERPGSATVSGGALQKDK